MNELRADILISGLDDWVSLAEAASLVRATHPALPENDVQQSSLAVLRDLLADELVKAGDVRSCFVAWPLDLGSALGEIARRLEQHGPDIGPWDGCWFANTTKGDQVAREAAAQPPSAAGR